MILMSRDGLGSLVHQAPPRRTAPTAASPQSSNAPHFLSQPSPETSSPQEMGCDSVRAQGTSLASPPAKTITHAGEREFICLSH